MSKHTIDELRDIPNKEIREIPDRNDLSKLYFNTNKGYQKGSVNFENSSNESAHTEYLKSLNSFYLKIGLLIPLPFSIALFLFNYFTNSISLADDAIITVPLIILSGLILIAVIVSIYRHVRDMLNKLGISTPYVLVYLFFCLSMLYTPVYSLCIFLVNPLLIQIATYLLVALATMAITKTLLIGLGDEEINRYFRLFLRIFPLFICLFVAIISSLVLY